MGNWSVLFRFRARFGQAEFAKVVRSSRSAGNWGSESIWYSLTVMRIDLYTRDDCPLCEEAKQVLARELRRTRHEIVEHDIRRNEEAEQSYRDEIPVVLIDGVKRFVGRINPVLLRRHLRARRS